MKINKLFLAIAFCAFGMAGELRADLNSDPWQMNVYTISSLGSSTSSYTGANIQGVAGSGGTAYLNNVGLNTSGSSATYSMYTSGNLTFTSSSSYNGGLSAGGNINYNHGTVVGNVQSGGNLTGTAGSIQGNVKLQGTNQSTATISGSVAQNQPFTSPFSGAAVSSYFQQASSFWAGLPATASWTNVYGQIVVSSLQAGRNIVNLALSNLNSAWGIQLTGPSNAFVVFNISDVSGTLNPVTFNFSGGMSSSNVLFNLPNSTSLAMSGGTYTSVLAPLATVTYGNGMLQGNFVANTLLGSGSFQTGAFSGFAADQANFAVVAPEPQTYVLLASLLAGAVYLRRRHALTKSSQ